MRFARFMNLVRERLGLPRKPIHYRIKAKGLRLGASPTPAFTWDYISWLWRSTRR